MTGPDCPVADDAAAAVECMNGRYGLSWPVLQLHSLIYVKTQNRVGLQVEQSPQALGENSAGLTQIMEIAGRGNY